MQSSRQPPGSPLNLSGGWGFKGVIKLTIENYYDILHLGDSRLLAGSIPDHSVDLVYTDPVYSNIADYEFTAQQAARILKPGRPCLVWIATDRLPQVLEVMTPHLNFRWQLTTQKNGGLWHGPTGITILVHCLWFDSPGGEYKPVLNIADWYRDGTNRASFPDSYSGHKWAKSIDSIARWLQAFSLPGALVVDFFTGSGTIPLACKMLGRHYWACEIDPAEHAKADRRLKGAQLPLFIPLVDSQGLGALI